jgi:hypothetical protein
VTLRWILPQTVSHRKNAVIATWSVFQHPDRLISERLGTRLWEDCERPTVGSRRASRRILAYVADLQFSSTTNPSLQLPAF